MKFFAPNVLIISDTIYGGESDTVGKPNRPSAAAAYEATLLKMQQRINGTVFGSRWLGLIGNNKEPITIVPSRNRTDAVAQTFPDLPPSKPNRFPDGMRAGFTAGGVTGTGKGTPMRVLFHPEVRVGISAASASGVVVLVHELTHAYRGARGRFMPSPMDGYVDRKRIPRGDHLTKRFPTLEEFMAVLYENVFSAELGATMLRLNWDITMPALADKPGPSTPRTFGETSYECFLRDYAPAIRRVMQLEPGIWAAMKASPAWFNPARDLPMVTA